MFCAEKSTVDFQFFQIPHCPPPPNFTEQQLTEKIPKYNLVLLNNENEVAISFCVFLLKF